MPKEVPRWRNSLLIKHLATSCRCLHIRPPLTAMMTRDRKGIRGLTRRRDLTGRKTKLQQLDQYDGHRQRLGSARPVIITGVISPVEASI